MQWLIEGFEDSCLSVDEGIFPVVFSGVKEEIVPFPEGRLNGEFFVESGDDFEVRRND